MTHVLIAALVAASPSGQTVFSPRVDVITKTVAATTYYLDGALGSDSNGCTSSGAGACATLLGIERKIPMVVRHPVTVSMASGNYTGVAFTDRIYSPADITLGAYIVLQGSLTTATPTTGSATGTATSAQACALGPPLVDASLTNSGASWTANDFRGLILETTGGTGSGQFIPIASNTSTTITLAGCWATTPNATTTFAVRTWGAVINTAVNQAPNFISTAGNATGLAIIGSQGPLRNNNAAAFFIDSIKVEVSTTSYALQVVNSNVYARRSRFTATGGGIGVEVDGSSRLNFQNSIASATTGNAFVQSAFQGGQALRAVNSLFQSSTGSAMVWAGPGLAFTNSTSLTTGAATNNILVSATSTGQTVIGLRVVCTAGQSTTGISALGASNSSPNIPSGPINLLFDSSATRECAVGIALSGQATTLTTDDSTFQATAGTTAISVGLNASVSLDVNSITSGSFTNAILLDGVQTSFATVASNPHVLSSTTRASILSIP